MSLPNWNRARELFQEGQDYVIDNGKNVTLYFPSYPSGSPVSATTPGNFGGHFMFGGDNVYEPGTFMQGSGQPMIEVRPTGTVKLSATYNPQSKGGKFTNNENIGIEFKKELNYVYSKGYMSDYFAVLNCDFAIFPMPSGADRMKFKLIGAPQDRNTIVQGRYFSCWWEQIP